jgi:hypothetical protein
MISISDRKKYVNILGKNEDLNRIETVCVKVEVIPYIFD